MVSYPSFSFPSTNTQPNSAFAPARVDLSRIGQIYGNYLDSQDAASKRQNEADDRAHAQHQRQQMEQIAQSGMPRDAQGNFDAASAADRLWRLGQFDKATNVVSGQQPKLTDDQREYAAAKQQGYGGSFMDYMKEVKSYGAQRTNINMPHMESEYDKNIGKELATEFVNANRTAATAQRDLANLDVMSQALSDPNLYTGTGGNVIQGLKKGAETLFGVPVKGTSSGEIMQNLASEIAVANKDKLPGPMSDADRQFLVDMAPNLSKTPEGNRLIIGLAMEHKRWQIARAQAARNYASKNGGRLDSGYYAAVGDLDAEYGQKFSSILGQMRGMGEMAPRSPTVGTGLNPGIYNWSPDGGVQEAK